MVESERLQWWRLWIFPPVLIGSAVAFVTLTVRALDLTSTAGTWGWFWIFALLPGIVGVANHIVTDRQRSAAHNGATGRPEQAESQHRPRPNEALATALAEQAESQHRPRLSEALAAALVLTGIFLVVAKAAVLGKEMNGLVYAGYGAYISSLWSMLVRLNVSALSPRFLINSALKTSIAMVLGFVASSTALFKDAPPALYFLIGFCLAWALKALKQSAMVTFGVTQTTAADLSVRLLEGVDDGAVDVLEELGITSIQHLATMNAAEVCGRSQYPRDRVLDWIDQSILVMHANGRIDDFRAFGIRSAYALVTVAEYAFSEDKIEDPLHKLAEKRLDDAGKRLGLSEGALQITAECIRRDPSYIALDGTYPGRHDPACPATAENEPDSKSAPVPMVPIKAKEVSTTVGGG